MSQLLALELEKTYGYPNACIIGVDEVGRGCLAGPVTAAAVCLPLDISQDQEWLSFVNDSKKMSPALRQKAALKLHNWSVSVSFVEPKEIDQINILKASLKAMAQAIEGVLVQLPTPPKTIVLVDGKFSPPFQAKGVSLVPVIGGDRQSLAIACASVVAKVARDAFMNDMDAQFPGYHFAAHKGYATATHVSAIHRLGLTPLHRKTFRVPDLKA